MRIDLGDLCKPHLAKLQAMGLDRHGYDADVYDWKIAQNEYADAKPEYVNDINPSFQCKVFMGQPFQGLRIEHRISISDKLDTQIVITTNRKLTPKSRLVVKTPCKQINLRVIEAWAFHAQSDVSFKYLTSVLVETP